ncbi:MAG: response regulator transcription factor, partial [Planctomycetes bacterium]|nr:response regulator transcription factor [Planctomycetota bacterium]
LEHLERLIKVLVADDHTMVRDGICAVLALQKDMSVVGEASDGKEALDKVPRLMPDVALLDIQMPIMSGVQATKEIVKQYPQTKVLILTQYDEEENMQICAQAGALGFIPKKAASSQLATGVRTVYDGTYFPMTFKEMVGVK